MKILIVEDSLEINEAISKGLKLKGFSTDSAIDGEEGLNKIKINEYDAAIIDISLPKINGINLAREIRELSMNIPLIALTARDSLGDKIKGFESGFDDYITKPFEFDELIARLEAHIRRSKPNNDIILKTKKIILDPVRRDVLVENEKVDLTKIEFNILEYLLRNKSIVISNNELIEHIWTEEPDMIDPPIRSHIKNLRRKIKDNNLDIIITIPGIGYKIE